MLVLTEDLKRLSDKLVESNAAKVALQLNLDELQSSEVSIKVSDITCSSPFCWFRGMINCIIEGLICDASFLIQIQYREKRMEQEKDLLQSQNTWLNTELKTKSEELLSLSREKGNEILELKCNLENRNEEVRPADFSHTE